MLEKLNRSVFNLNVKESMIYSLDYFQFNYLTLEFHSDEPMMEADIWYVIEELSKICSSLS